MRCSVKNCNNEARECFYPSGRCNDCDLSSEIDLVVVSEYEAYLAWKYGSISNPFIGSMSWEVKMMQDLSSEEFDSALFGYWNEEVRR